MHRYLKSIPSLLLVGFAVVACETSSDRSRSGGATPDADAIQRADRMMATTPFEEQARRGVERQKTLYDYHFEPDTASLTPLGRRDIDVLAVLFRRDGGRVSVRRGPVSESLYAARVSSVRDRLVADGVDEKRIVIDDGDPGGRGVTSREAILIRSEIRLKDMAVPTGSILAPMGGSEEVNR